jgi:serine/threonine-protein kinase
VQPPPHASPAPALTDVRARLQSSLGAAYTLERELGGGGMSRVFVARDEALGRDVVVKVLAPDLAAGVSAERFAREIRLAAALQEPHIVPVLAAGATAEGLPYYTMPFVRGRSLRDRLHEGPVPAAEAVEILRDVAKALAYAHRQGVVHRDIKPENVLLHEGTAVVTDFGIAKAISASKTQAPGGTLTQVGTSLGTPAYMAPEQAAGGEVDHRADLYAWGVMAYELLAGAHPFAGKASPQAMIVAHFVEMPAALDARAPHAPAGAAAIVMQCLAKEPEARPAGAADVLAAIAAPGSTPVAFTAAPRPVERSVAVLPFESLSPDPADAFLADGLCEEIVTDLARLKAVRVIARNSAAQYKGTAKDARTVGRELGARHLLSGSVRRAGNALRVTAQLVDAEQGAQAWAERFSGTVDDVFEIQERIARQIVAALEVTLTPEEDRRLAVRSIQNVQAFEWYLRARQDTLSFSARALEDALVLLDRAAELEGERALILATRALTIWNQFNIRLRGEEVLGEVRVLTDRALALDSELAPALLVRALLEYSGERVDGGLVLRLLLRAAAAERSADVSLYLTFLLAQAGLPGPAAQYGRLARQLDPLSPLAVAVGAFPPLMVGSGEDALPDLAAVAARFPEAHIVRFLYGMMQATVGRVGEGADTLRGCEPEGVYGTLSELLRRALAGDRVGVLALTGDPELRRAAERDDQYSWTLAQALAQVGELDGAMAWLRHGADRTFVNARFIAEYDQLLAPLRAHPEMPALLAHMERRAAEIALAGGL